MTKAKEVKVATMILERQRFRLSAQSSITKQNTQKKKQLNYSTMQTPNPSLIIWH